MCTEDCLSIPTVVLSFFSIASCVIVCIVSLKEGYVSIFSKCSRRRKSRITSELLIEQNDVKHQMMMEIIFWLCVVDGLWSIELFLNWFRQMSFLKGIQYWNKNQCIFLGIYSQFLGNLSPLFHVLLAYHLCFLLFGGSLKSLDKQKYYHYLILILIASVDTIIPLFPTNHYGAYTNPNTPNDIIDMECWLITADYQWIWSVTTFVSLFFHYFTLILAIYKWKHSSFFILSPHYKTIVVKLTRFVTVYTFIRLLPVTDRVVEISTGKSYFPLLMSNHLLQGCVGIANAMVFFYNRNESKHKHYGPQLKKNKKEHTHSDIWQQSTTSVGTSLVVTPINANTILQT